MKKWMAAIGLISMISSFSASACPNLEGDYICRGAGQVQEVQIQQDLRNDVWTYHLDLGEGQELSVLTDGRTHNIGTFQRIEDASYKAKCAAQKLSVDASGNLFVMGRTFRAQSKMSFSPASNGRITSTASLIVDGRNVQNVKLDCRPL